MSKAARRSGSPLGAAIADLRGEMAEIDLLSPRAQHCARTTLAVALTVIASLVLRLDAPWWAAISAFVSLQLTAPA